MTAPGRRRSDSGADFQTGSGGGWGRGRDFIVVGGAVSGVDDAAGLTPGGDEVAACGGGVVVDDEVVEVLELFHQGGDFGVEVFQKGGAVDDAGAGGGIDAGEFVERGLECGDESGGDAAAGGSGLAGGGGADGDEIGGGGDEELVAEFLIVAELVIDLGAAGEIAGFLEMAGEGAGGLVAKGFERALGIGLGIGIALGGGGGTGGKVFGDIVIRGEFGEILAETERGDAVPDGAVFIEIGNADAGFDGAEAVGENVVHGRGGFRSGWIVFG